MKVGDGREKQFLVKVKDDGAGEMEERHKDYVQEGKIAQQHQHIEDLVRIVPYKTDDKEIAEIIKRLRIEGKKKSGATNHHHLPGHQDYVQENKITQQRYSIDKESKKTELGSGPTRPMKIIDIKCYYDPDGSCSCRDCEYLSESHRLKSVKKREEDAKEIAEITKKILEKDKKKNGATNLSSGPPQYSSRPPSSALLSYKLG